LVENFNTTRVYNQNNIENMKNFVQKGQTHKWILVISKGLINAVKRESYFGLPKK